MLDLFSPQTREWFSSAIGAPTAVQSEGWPRIASGEHVLVSAPTGTGKTLTAFLVFIDRLKEMARQGTLRDRLYVLYVSPLKALAGDIRENLKRPNEGIEGEELRFAVRTGDTTPAERARMLKKPPHILITTPESLFLLLTAPRSRALLRDVQAVIVDELHALIGSKRGAHLMLSLARLDALCDRKVQRIGLSATISPLDLAAQYLSYPAPCAIVAPSIRKDSEIVVTSPLPDLRMISGTVWHALAQKVYQLCQGARTVIAFVEGRQQAERLAYGVNALAGEGFARTHHGCVSKEQRHVAEQQLRSGQLRLLCATSSMELGIDVGEVDLVVQIGCPLTVSGALQRLGRAGHQPGITSVMRIFAKTAADALYCGLTARTAMEGGIEPACPPQGCLDVLSQHLVSMAVDGGYAVADALNIAHGCWSFRDITRNDVEDCLAMLAGDWEHDQDRPVRARILYDRINGRVLGDAYARMLAYSAGGTIPDRGWYPVVLPDGTRLGELDEEYVFEARVGNKFLLGAFAWRIAEIGRDRVIVNPATPEGAQPPFWKGDGLGRAYSVGLRFGRMLEEIESSASRHQLEAALRSCNMDGDAAANAARHIRLQRKATGCLPTHRRMILEHFTDEAGEHQMMVHSVFGKRVNYALALLCQHEAQSLTGQDVHIFDDDDGFLLFLVGGGDIPEGLLHRLDPDASPARVRALLPATPLFSMTFRYAAGCALMMGAKGGRRQPLWVQRLRGAEQLSALVDKDRHPLIREAMRACMEDYLDFDALREVLSKVRSGEIEVREMHLDTPSPMALPMRRAAEMTLMYEYDNIPTKAVRTVQQKLEAQSGIVPTQDSLDTQFSRGRLPEDAGQLHSLLMTEGDLAAGEMDVPVEWLTTLAEQGRARYIEPGLWIAEEMEPLYTAALTEGDMDALCRVARLCLRYRGGQDARSLSDRYLIPEEAAREALSRLVREGRAVESDGVTYHEQVYQRAQQDTLRARRASVETLPPERFAALLADGVRQSGSPREQTAKALESLCGLPFPFKLWESVLLPARVNGYQPRYLDECLSAGAFVWRLRDGNLSFTRAQDIDWDAEPEAPARALDGDERILLDALRRRGASFHSALSPLLGGRSALDALLGLARDGLVRCDSLVPLRISQDVLSDARAAGKRLARARANAMSAGRWELARGERPMGAEELLDRAFDRCPLLCRETVTQLSWSQAVELLRVWEYTGRARRGYFVRGLPGMQFIRSADYDRVRRVLDTPQPQALWLSAADPAQPYGKTLPHAPGRDFLRVPGTAVCLVDGRVVALSERQGETLRVFEPDCAAQALSALARDHLGGRVFPERDKLTVKTYPPEAAEALEKAGFTRVMLDYVLYR
jgi:ATP-dependent Lhr-like helicase